MTTISEYAPTMTLPAVECAHWCQDKDGHANERFVADQYCSSETERIELASEPLLLHKGKVEGRSFLDVGLRRDAYSTLTLVDIGHNEEGPVAIKLTIEEAEALGLELIRLVKAARTE